MIRCEAQNRGNSLPMIAVIREEQVRDLATTARQLVVKREQLVVELLHDLRPQYDSRQYIDTVVVTSSAPSFMHFCGSSCRFFPPSIPHLSPGPHVLL